MSAPRGPARAAGQAEPRRLVLRHAGGECPILVGNDVLEAAVSDLSELWRGRSIFLLSTPVVGALFGDRLEHALAESAARVARLEAPDGEGAKTVEQAARLWSALVEAGGKRDSVLVDLGGGSLGDLGGFVAACFLRGIEFVQVPTTLLAQVDAAIGGKTAVDLPAGKNTVGAFRQPAAVIVDTALLRTLPARDLRAGFAEVVKIAAVLDAELFVRLERELEALLAGDPSVLVPTVERAIALKVAVVEEDPHERDRRRLLNFGHTLGHAIEAALGYAGLLHGEAVAHGMRFALRLASRLGLDPRSRERMAALVERLGAPALPALEPEALLGAMARDKKARESGLAWVLPGAIGRGEVRTDVPAALVSAELDGFLASGP